jgi:hypothetical protein
MFKRCRQALYEDMSSASIIILLGNPGIWGALGEDMGQLKLDDGTVIEAGRVMMRD